MKVLVTDKINELAGKEVVLRVVCNMPYDRKTKYISIDNIQWERNLAKETIRRSHLGIMPLIDGKVQRGKGGFKLIQYLSEGVPVIASDVGFCREVVRESCGFLLRDGTDWIKSVVKVATSEQEWVGLSEGAGERYKERFDFSRNARILVERIKGEDVYYNSSHI